MSLIYGGKSFGGFGNYVRDIQNYCKSVNIDTHHTCWEDLNALSSNYVRYFSRALDWLLAMHDAQKKARKLNFDNPLCMDVVASSAYPNSVVIVHGMLGKELETLTKHPNIHKKLSRLGIKLSERESIFMGRIRKLEINGLLVARKIIVTNGQVGEYIETMSGVKAEHIPNPLNTEMFKPMDKTQCKKRLGIPLDKKFVLFYCSSFEKYIDKYPQWERELEKSGFYVKNLRNSARYDEMPIWYNASDLTVMPQRIIALGRFCLESLACGTPHLGTNNPLGYSTSMEEIVNRVINFDFANVDRLRLRESVSEYSQDIIIPRVLALHQAN